MNQGGVYERGHINLDESVPVTQQVSQLVLQQHRGQSQNQNHNILRPYIKCPRDTIILIKNNQRTAFIKLEQPKSNVDWARYKLEYTCNFVCSELSSIQMINYLFNSATSM